ncbi:EamA family transporter [Methylocystis sp. B8]|uniref:EamA family transporter n=1 Tax=Methylocystis sp. B8 TaxID=544938 RepID=UPI001FEF0BA0|nr:EamA family transporter [Methylocystis sp. B8]
MPGWSEWNSVVRSPRAQAYHEPPPRLLLVLAALIWGAAFITQKNAGELMGPISFVGVRFLLSWIAKAR